MVEANTSVKKSKFEYDLFIVLLIGGLGGQTQFYKEQLMRNGMLEKAVLIENEQPTRESINQAIADVQSLIMKVWQSKSKSTFVHAYITGDACLGQRDMIEIKLDEAESGTFSIEKTLRNLCTIPHYLVWALFDCDRKERLENGENEQVGVNQ